MRSEKKKLKYITQVFTSIKIKISHSSYRWAGWPGGGGCLYQVPGHPLLPRLLGPRPHWHPHHWAPGGGARHPHAGLQTKLAMDKTAYAIRPTTKRPIRQTSYAKTPSGKMYQKHQTRQNVLPIKCPMEQNVPRTKYATRTNVLRVKTSYGLNNYCFWHRRDWFEPNANILCKLWSRGVAHAWGPNTIWHNLLSIAGRLY